MAFKSIIGVTCAYILIISTPPAFGSVIYSYTGNAFNSFSTTSSYTSEMAVTGTIELDIPLDANMTSLLVHPIHFSIGDGINIIDSANVTFSQFNFVTDESANIIEWSIYVQNATGLNAVGDTTNDILTTFSFNPLASPRDIGSSLVCTTVINELCVAGDTDTARVSASPGAWAIVPIPAAVWLFGSGLIGLIGVARRKIA